MSAAVAGVGCGLLMAVTHRVLAAVGIVIALAGGVFTLQGVGVLGGSFMSGSGGWAVIGIALVIGGITLYGWANRTR